MLWFIIVPVAVSGIIVMVEYKLTHFAPLYCLLLQVVSGSTQDLRTSREFWNFVGAVAKRPCMPNTVPYCKEIEEVKG